MLYIFSILVGVFATCCHPLEWFRGVSTDTKILVIMLLGYVVFWVVGQIIKNWREE